MTRLRLSRGFERDLKGLPLRERKRIESALRALVSDPRRRGLNFEKLGRDGSLYTIRVNRRFRVVLQGEEDDRGKLYVAVSVGHHDRACG